MSEQGRDPLIRLDIDQEVFTEFVHAKDQVDDATVATEIVSFDKVDEMYVLEGAIVFAGYVRKASEATDEENTSFSIGVEDEAHTVQHVHHRLPFVLRVPVAAQVNGIVNVKSRLSGFTLDVVSDNWFNVKGTLEVHGLVGADGFHFRCGAQEEGDAFFHAPVEATEEAVDAFATEADTRTEELEGAGAFWRGEQAEDDAEEVTEHPSAEGVSDTEYRSTEGFDETENTSNEVTESEDVSAYRGESSDAQERAVQNSALEKVSEARSGHGWAEEHRAGEVQSEVQEEPKSARNELANLDRFFVPEPVDQAPVADEGNSTEGAPVASFEFEHQLEEDEVAHAEEMKEETPQPLRSEVSKLESIIPRFTISSSSVPTEEVEPAIVETKEENFERHELKVTSVSDQTLWSFVNFNGEEPRHTVRYVIVMEEETIETVADRCGCLPSELTRVNPGVQGQLAPGQALYVPEKPFSLPRV